MCMCVRCVCKCSVHSTWSTFHEKCVFVLMHASEQANAVASTIHAFHARNIKCAMKFVRFALVAKSFGFKNHSHSTLRTKLNETVHWMKFSEANSKKAEK